MATQKNDGLTHATTDHETIRSWVEDRGGSPAAVEETAGDGDEMGILRIDFPDYTGEESLVEVDWDDWFEKFDRADLAFIYQEETSGGEKSNFNKLVSRETVQDQL